MNAHLMWVLGLYRLELKSKQDQSQIVVFTEQFILTLQINQKFRKERFIDVPLCATDCDHWFNDCAEDYTCTKNWGRNFDWKGGINKCPVGSTCKPFNQIFKDSKEFCETIWDNSFKYTSNSDYCMRLWFNSTMQNPNDKVSEWKVEQLLNSSIRITFNQFVLSMAVLTSWISS